MNSAKASDRPGTTSTYQEPNLPLQILLAAAAASADTPASNPIPNGISVRVSDLNVPSIENRVVSLSLREIPASGSKRPLDKSAAICAPIQQRSKIKVPIVAAQVTVGSDSRKRYQKPHHWPWPSTRPMAKKSKPVPKTGNYSVIDSMLQEYVSKVADRSLITLVALKLKVEEIARFHSVKVLPDLDDWLDEWRLVHNVALDDDGSSDDGEAARLIDAFESGDVEFLDDVSETSYSGSEFNDIVPKVEVENSAGGSGEFQVKSETPDGEDMDSEYTVTAPTLRETVDAIGVLRRYLESKKELRGLEILKELEDKVWRAG